MIERVASPSGDAMPSASNGGRFVAAHPSWLGAARPAWLAEVTDWLNRVVLSQRHESILDVAPVRERPWGAVLRVRTTGGILYLKAEGLGARHEPDLIATLAPAWADLVPEVFAVDNDRSWMVMADHDAPMWDVHDTAGQVTAWEQLLPVYADLQAWSAAVVPALFRAGAPDRRMSRPAGYG